MDYYIGLDAHSQTCTFVTLDHSGREVNYFQCDTSEENLLSYLNRFNGKKSLTFEETSMSKWLYSRLKSHVDEIIVCNPAFVSKKRGAKTDYLDAKHLASELRSGNLEKVFHDNENELIKLRSFYQSYNDLVTDTTRTKNRLKALFRAEAKLFPGAGIYSDSSYVKSLTSLQAQMSAEILYSQLEVLRSSREKYIEVFKNNFKKFPVMKRLATIPGIDVVRANTIAILIADGKRFKNKHLLWSYASLVTHPKISDGTSYGAKKAIGRLELKSAFMGAATSVLMGTSSLRKYYDQLRSKGLDDKKSKKAVARKIAAISLCIMKNETVVFDDKWMEKEKRLNKK